MTPAAASRTGYLRGTEDGPATGGGDDTGLDGWNAMPALALASCCMTFLLIAGAALTFPWDLELFEGVHFLPSLRLTEGQAIYGEPAALSPPYVVSPYGPFYYATLGLLLRGAGVVFWPGRLLSVCSTLLCVFLLAKIVRRSTSDWGAPFLSAAAFLLAPGVWTYGTLQRVDMFGLAWVAVSLALAPLGRRREAGAAMLSSLAGMAAALAFLTKSSLFGGAVAIAIALAARSWQLAVCYVLGWFGLAGFGLATITTFGVGDYLFNLRLSGFGPYSASTAVEVARSVFAGPVATMLLVSMTLAVRRLRQDFALAVFWSYACLALVLGVSTCARVGSSANYFFEFYLGAAIVLGMEIGRIPPRSGYFASTAVATVLAVQAVLFNAGFVRGRFVIPRRKAPIHESVLRELRALDPTLGPIVSDYPDLVLRAGREPFFHDLPPFIVGPAPLREVRERFLAEKRAAAFVAIDRRDFPGYRLVPLQGYQPESWGMRRHYEGPLLFVRMNSSDPR